MARNAAISGIRWDLAGIGSIEQSQGWVLSAMQQQGPSLVTMLWRILGNEQDVCDAYQQTFLNLVHNENGKKPRSVRAYLHRTAANIAITMLRKKRVHEKSTKVLAITKPKTSNPDYGGEIDAMFLQKKLRTAISKLPDYLREVVLLHDLGEMSYQEIAGIVGVSTSSVRVYRSKAIALLAVWMGKEKGE